MAVLGSVPTVRRGNTLGKSARRRSTWPCPESMSRWKWFAPRPTRVIQATRGDRGRQTELRSFLASNAFGRTRDQAVSLLTLVHTKRLRNSSNVESMLTPELLPELVNLVDDGIGALHPSVLRGSSSGVQITGAAKPSARQMSSILPRIVALAMCLQFMSVGNLGHGPSQSRCGARRRRLEPATRRQRSAPPQAASPPRSASRREDPAAHEYASRPPEDRLQPTLEAQARRQTTRTMTESATKSALFVDERLGSRLW
jgi:hypothetical protein